MTGDEVYGNDGGLRRWLEQGQRPYVLAAARSHAVWRGGEQAPADAWVRLEVAPGCKGPRVDDWARARLPDRTEDGWVQWLLLHRSVGEPAEVAYYRAYGRADASVEDLARVAGTRWVVEEGFARTKGEVGLDQDEVRTWAA